MDLKMDLKTILFWAVFVLFALGAVSFSGSDRPFTSAGPMPAGKHVVWAIFAAFLAYSIHVSCKEDIVKGLLKILELRWGRQVGLDLYVGLSLALCVVGLHEGALMALVWLIPAFAFGNLTTLLYVAIHYDSLVARFVTQG